MEPSEDQIEGVSPGNIDCLLVWNGPPLRRLAIQVKHTIRKFSVRQAQDLLDQFAGTAQEDGSQNRFRLELIGVCPFTKNDLKIPSYAEVEISPLKEELLLAAAAHGLDRFMGDHKDDWRVGARQKEWLIRQLTAEILSLASGGEPLDRDDLVRFVADRSKAYRPVGDEILKEQIKQVSNKLDEVPLFNSTRADLPDGVKYVDPDASARGHDRQGLTDLIWKVVLESSRTPSR